MRAAGLEAGAGKAAAAERLHADHRAYGAAIDVDVADAAAAFEFLGAAVDAAVQAQRQAVARSEERRVGKECRL